LEHVRQQELRLSAILKVSLSHMIPFARVYVNSLVTNQHRDPVKDSQ